MIAGACLPIRDSSRIAWVAFCPLMGGTATRSPPSETSISPILGERRLVGLGRDGVHRAGARLAAKARERQVDRAAVGVAVDRQVRRPLHAGNLDLDLP